MASSRGDRRVVAVVEVPGAVVADPPVGLQVPEEEAVILSTKGWLASSGPSAPRRMTEQQVRMAERCVHDALDRAVAAGELVQDRAATAREVLCQVLDAYPKDRSCATCDFERGGHCLHWEQDVPAEHFESGCDQHRVQGAPF